MPKFNNLSLSDTGDALEFDELDYNADEGFSDEQYSKVLKAVAEIGAEARAQGKPQYLVIIARPERRK